MKLMLSIRTEKQEFFNQITGMFESIDSHNIQLEHSLISISKWESKYKKAFLNDQKKNPKTNEEILYYIKCMCLKHEDEEFVKYISVDNLTKISEYINDSHSATYIPNIGNESRNRDIPTSELIYYWMIVNGIPFECQYWHLGRLLKLIEICSLKNSNKKMSKQQILQSNRKINEARKLRHHTKG